MKEIAKKFKRDFFFFLQEFLIPVYQKFFGKKSSSKAQTQTQEKNTDQNINNQQQQANLSPKEQALEEVFSKTCEAVKISNLFGMLNQQQQLALYGLYKQATEGDCNQPKPRGMVDVKKWEAWKERAGMSKEQAKFTYIKQVQDFAPNLDLTALDDEIKPKNDDDIFMTEEEYRKQAQERKQENKIGYGMTFSKPIEIPGLETGEEENHQITKFFNCILEENLSELEDQINQGFDINLENQAGAKAIHYAIDNEKELVVEFLACLYSDINVKDSVGNTPLHYAVLIENENIIDSLLEKGADPFRENDEGETAYSLATKKIKQKFDEKKSA